MSARNRYLTPRPEGLPADLASRRQWVCWRAEKRDGRLTKVPYSPMTGYRAKTNKPGTWGDYETALNAYRNGHDYSGVGFVFSENDGFIGVDLDNCRNPKTGELGLCAAGIVDELDSYTEVSPSGTGVHIILRGRLPPGRKKNGNVEIYDRHRFFAVTGVQVNGTRNTIEERQAALKAVHERSMGKATPRRAPSVGTHAPVEEDEQLLDQAKAAKNGAAFSKLLSGDTSDYPSHSEADLAFCSHLSFWTNRDARRIDRIFRRSELFRDKWDRLCSDGKTYGEVTIAKALAAAQPTLGGHSARIADRHSVCNDAVHEGPWPNRGEVSALPPVPKLSLEHVPEALRGWVSEKAERACFNPEFVAIPLIISIGSLVGSVVGIRPQRNDDWGTVPNLYGAIIGPPGVMKSHAIESALAPLTRLASSARRIFEKEEEEVAAARDLAETEIESIKRKMKQARLSADQRRGLGEELSRKKNDLKMLSVAERRYITNDATTEKIGEILRENPRGILVARDELAAWMSQLNKPGREGDREFYLEAWNGGASHTVDRIGRGTLYIPNLTISIVGGIQPTKLRRYIESAQGGGAGADGLLQRLQLLVWPDRIAPYKKATHPPNRGHEARIWGIFRWLDEKLPEVLDELGVVRTDGSVPHLCFAPDAEEYFDAWRARLEARLRSGELDTMPAFEAHLSKYRSLMPILALLFHLIDVADGGEPGEVTRRAAEMAATWCEFLENHARKIYADETYPGVSAAKMLADKIEKGDVTDRMPVRTIYRRGWAGLGSASALYGAISVLADAGWVKIEEVPTQGRPSEVLRLHPELRRTE